MKKQIRVNTEYLAPWTRKYYANLLSERFELIECTDPDYVLVGVGRHCLDEMQDHMASGFLEDFPEAKVRIFLQHEAVGFDFTLFDYAVLFTEKVTLEDRVFHSHFFSSGYFTSVGFDVFDRLLKKPAPETLLESKQKFCCFHYAHGKGVPERLQLFEQLSGYRRVDSLGKFKNNTTLPEREHYAPGWFHESVDVKKPYKFTIACENCLHPNGYAISEKLVGAMLANTIPIYWGAPRVGEYFNSKAIINCHDYSSMDGVVEAVRRIDQDDQLWCEMMREPWLNKEQYLSHTSNLGELKKFLFRIFEQPLEQAVRRPRGFWIGRYEAAKRQIVRNSRQFVRDALLRNETGAGTAPPSSSAQASSGRAPDKAGEAEPKASEPNVRPALRPRISQHASPAKERLVALLKRADPTILEVGANDGSTTRWLLGLGERATVICFEPDVRARAAWRERICDARARLVEVAVSDTDGRAAFYASRGKPPWPWARAHSSGGWDKSGSLRRPIGHLEKYPWCQFDETVVPTIRLDTWAKENGLGTIELIFADVQGAGLDFIRGARATLDRTCFLHIDYNEREIFEGNMSLQGLMDELPNFEIVELYPKHVLVRNSRHSLPT